CILARLLLSVPELVAGRKVLEIGAGFHGIVALAAQQAGACSVLATDVDRNALHLLKMNMAKLSSRLGEDGRKHICELSSSLLDWSKPDPSLGSFEVILGTDVVHETWMGAAILNVLKAHLAPGGLAVIVNAGSKHRYGIDELQDLLRPESSGRSAESRSLEGTWFCFEEATLESLDTQGLSHDCYLIRRSVC
ncbi:unnamed protein product, partial [Polarella glacialis]